MRKVSLNMATEKPVRLFGRTYVTGENAKALRLAVLRGEMSNRYTDINGNFQYTALASISAGVEKLFIKYHYWGY